MNTSHTHQSNRTFRTPWARLSTSATLFALSGVLSFAAAANAGVDGAKIKRGDVSFSQDGNTLRVRASNGAIIEYNRFSVEAGQIMQFIQPSATSRVLNRVTGSELSRIDGSLLSNGIVYLVNPQGIRIGNGALINVGGFYAAAGAMSDKDFIRGNNNFTSLSGKVVNEGMIHAQSVALVGQYVANRGTIQVDDGVIAMASGDTVFLQHGTGPIMVTVNRSQLGADGSGAGTQAGVSNTGTINAGKGKVAMASGDFYALAMDLSGTIIGKSIAARGGAGNAPGNGGVVAVNGTLDASSTTSKGGTIDVFGERVGVMSGALVNANGATGGGSVRIGGDYLGGNVANAPQATATYIDSNARVTANATQSGDGGRVIVWSNEYTGFFGSIDASAAGSGNGGFIETSSHDNLQAFGSVNAKSARGKAGTWLLDPSDVTITNSADAGGAFNSSSPNVFTPTAATATADVATVNSSLNGGTSVTINTGSVGDGLGGAGNITLAAAIEKTAGGNATLTLNAVGSITLSADITSTVGALSVALNAGTTVSMGAITTNGGDVNVNAGGGVFVANNVITSGTGEINITGNTNSAVRSQFGVNLREFVTIQTTDGDLNITGTGGSANSINWGIYTNAGDIICSIGSGNVTVTGTGGTIGNGNYGVLHSTGATITSNSGFVLVKGTGGSNSSAFGIHNFGTITSSGTGSVTVEGVAGNIGDTNSNYGVVNAASGADGGVISSSGGTVTVVGTGAAGWDAIYLVNNSSITSLGALTLTSNSGAINQVGGTITVDGTTTITAGTNNVTLAQATNDFGGAVSVVSANNVSLADANTLTLGASTVANNFTATAAGGVVVAGNVTAGGTGAINITGNTNADTSLRSGVGVTVIAGMTIQSTNGELNITGTGGSNPADNYGVANSGTITSSGTGNVSVTGTGGIGVNGLNIGVHNYNGTITSGGGNVNVTGTGGLNSRGWGIYNSGGTITSGGAGNVTVMGTGANGDGSVGVYNLSNTISSGGSGSVTVTGTGGSGSGSSSQGIINNGTITSGTGGNVFLTGTGGSGAAGTNYGVTSFGTITAGVSGNVAVTGTGGTGGSNNYAIFMNTGSITAPGALTLTSNGGAINQVGGTITVNGTTTITAGTSPTFFDVTLAQSTNNFVGAVSVVSANNVSLADANTLTLGASTVGNNFTATAASGVVVAGNVTAAGTGEINITGNTNVTPALRSIVGVTVNNGVTIQSTNGNLIITGTGGADVGGNNYGVYNVGTITSSGIGNVTVTGTGGNGADGENYGVLNQGVDAANKALITSGGGNVVVTGTGGTSTNATSDGVSNDGIYMINGKITSGVAGTVTVTGIGGESVPGRNHGIRNKGTITSGGIGEVIVRGTGGTSTGDVENVPNSNYGIINKDGAIISSGGGAVTVIGVGGNGVDGMNYGIQNMTLATIQSGGTGSVTVTGTGGNGSGGLGKDNYGVYNFGSEITSGGDLTITGNGGNGVGGFNNGVYSINDGPANGAITSGGNLVITGTGGAGAAGFNAGVYTRHTELISSGSMAITGEGGTGGTNVAIVLVDGPMNVGGNFSATASLTAGSTNSKILIEAPITTTNGGAVDMNARAGALSIEDTGVINSDGVVTLTAGGGISTAGNVTTTGDDVNYESATTLTGDILVNTGAGADINFASTLNGNHNLSLTAGIGNIVFADVVGATPLGVVTVVSANNVSAGGGVAQNSFNASTLTLTSVTGTATFTGPLNLTTLSPTAGVNNFSSTGTTGIITNAVAFTNTGNLTLGQAGGIQTFTNGLDTTGVGGSVTMYGTFETGGGPLDFGNLVLATDTLYNSNGFAINFNGTVNGTNPGAQSLGLIAGAGNIQFVGVVGGVTPLGAITITSANDVTAFAAITASSFTQDAGTGTTTFNGLLNLAGAFDFTGINLQINGLGTNIADKILIFQSGNFTLADDANIEVTNAGGLFFQGRRGTNIIAGNITADSSLQFVGDVQLAGAGAVVLTVTNGGLTDLLGLENITGPGQSLVLDSNTNIEVAGNIGTSANPLRDFFISNAADATFGGTINAARFIQDAGTGTTTLNGLINLTDTFNVFSGNNLVMNGLGNNIADMIDIDLNGNFTLADGANIQVTTNLGHFVSSGTNTIAGNITADEYIEFAGDVEFAGINPVELTVNSNTNANSIYFTGNITGAGKDLTLNTVGGIHVVTGDIGTSASPLGNIKIINAIDATFGGTVDAASFTQDAGTGTTTFNGLNLTGAFNFTGNALSLNNVGRNLVGTSGSGMDVTNRGLFTIANGANLEVSRVFTQDGDGLNSIGGTIESINDGISFKSGVMLTDNVTMYSAGDFGNNIIFSSTLDGDKTLALRAGNGDITFTGAVGAGTRLGAITITSAQNVTAGGGLAQNSFNASTLTLTSVTGTATFTGPLNLTTLSPTHGVNNFSSTGTTGTITNAVAFTNTGNLTLGQTGGIQTFTNGLDTTGVGGVVTMYGTFVTGGGPLNFGNLVLPTDTVFNSSGYAINFNGTVNGTTAGAQTLGLIAGAGNIQFVGVVGGEMPLGAITITSANNVTAFAAITASSFTQDAGTGTTTFNGITTTTAGALDVTTINVTFNDAAVTFTDMLIDVSGLLTMNMQNSTQDESVIGGAFAQTGTGRVFLQGGGPRDSEVLILGLNSFAPVFNATFTGAVTIDGSADIGVGSGSANVHFLNTVDSAVGASGNLTVDTGNIVFDRNVGAIRPLGTFDMNIAQGESLLVSGTLTAQTVVAGPIPNLLQTPLETTSTFEGLITTGNYGGVAPTDLNIGTNTVTLNGGMTTLDGGDVFVAGHTINFANGTTIASDGSIKIMGDIQGLNNTLNLGADMTTTGGEINFQISHTALTGDVSINSAGGNITFGGTLNGTLASRQSLDLTAGTGDILFSGNVRGAFFGLLGTVSVLSAHDVTFNGTANATSFIQNTGTGTTTFNGAVTLTKPNVGPGGNFYFNGNALVMNGVSVVGNNFEVESRSGFVIAADVTTQGTGTINITSNTLGLSQNGVTVNGGVTIQTTDGDLNITGMGGSNVGGYNYGVYNNGGKIQSGGAGNVSVTGTGGNSDGDRNYGVLNDNNALITSGGGTVLVTGRGGNGASDYNEGVRNDNGSIVTTGVSGTVTVIGFGGSGNGEFNYGVVNLSTITSDGDIEVTGTGGNGDGGYNLGVYNAGDITSGGEVIVTGTGGTGDNNNYGVYNAGDITSSGEVIVTGTGGTGGNDNYGVLNQGGTITSSGEVIVTGTGGTGVLGNDAIAIQSGFITAQSALTLISNGGAINQTGGTITVVGTTTITAGANDVTLAQSTNNFGGAVTVVSARNVSLADTNALILGVSTVANNFTATAGGGIVVADDITAGVTGAINITGNTLLLSQTGVTVNSGVTIQTTNGDLNITGTGGSDAGGYNYGVLNNGGTITSGGAGSVTVTGTGGSGAGGFNYGIINTSEPSIFGRIASSGSGTVNVIGMGGSAGGNNFGVENSSRSTITSGGAGRVFVNGIGGGGGVGSSNNWGIANAGTIGSGTDGNVLVDGAGGFGDGGSHAGIFNFGMITSGGIGNVTVRGVAGDGGGLNVGVKNTGISSTIVGTITSGGAGSVTVSGFGGIGVGGNSGVENVNGATITSGGGDVAVNGTGGDSDGDRNYGVLNDNNALITSFGAGNVRVTGSGGSGGGKQNHGVSNFNGSIITSGGSGTVTVIGVGGSSTGGLYSLNWGVVNSSSITSSSNVTVTGTGGSGDGGFNFGIVNNDGTITSVGGDVTLVGVGGSGLGGQNCGVYNYRGAITSGGAGSVTVTGTGGSGGIENYGIVNDGTITSVGGDVTLVGFGGSGVGGFNGGFYNYGGTITSGSGAVTVEGTGGTVGSDNDAIFIEAGSIIAPSDLTLISNGGAINQTGGTIEVSGATTLKASVMDTDIHLAGGLNDFAGTMTIDNTAGAALNVHDFELRNINATPGVITNLSDATNLSDFTIWYDNAGYTVPLLTMPSLHNVNITTGAGVVVANNVTAGTDGEINITGNTNSALRNQWGVTVSSNVIIQTTGGDLNITGTGGSNAGGSNFGVYNVGGTIRSGGVGNVTVEGTGGSGLGNNYGVYNGDGTIRSGGGGNVFVTGTGGSGGNQNRGVYNNGIVSSLGSGDVTVTGTGGSGANNDAIFMDRGFITVPGVLTLTSNGGAINQTGGTITVDGATTLKASVMDTDISLAGGLLNNFAGTVTIDNTAGAAMNVRDFMLRNVNAAAGDITNLSNVSNLRDFTIMYDNAGYTVPLLTMPSLRNVNISTGAGVVLANNVITGGTGEINITGNTNSAVRSQFGVNLRESVTIQTKDGALNITGTGGSASYNNWGIYTNAGDFIRSIGSGNVTVTGTGGTSGTGNYGVLHSTSATITSGSGNVLVKGTGGSNLGAFGINNYGTITSSGTGSVTVEGVAGNIGVTNINYGVMNAVGGSVGGVISSSGGTVTVVGTGAGGWDAIYLDNNSSITSLGALTLTSNSGAINQVGGTIRVDGTTTISVNVASTDISLAGGPNNFAGPVNMSGNDYDVRDFKLRDINSSAGAANPDVSTFVNLRDLTIAYDDSSYVLPSLTMPSLRNVSISAIDVSMILNRSLTTHNGGTVTFNATNQLNIADGANIFAEGEVNLTGTNGIFINGDITTTGKAVSFHSATQLTDSTLFTIDTTNGNLNPNGADIFFSDAITVPTDNTEALVLNAGTVGEITLTGHVGEPTRMLSNLTLTAANTIIKGDIYVAGNTTAGDITIINDTIIESKGSLTVGSIDGGGYAVTIATVDLILTAPITDVTTLTIQNSDPTGAITLMGLGGLSLDQTDWNFIGAGTEVILGGTNYTGTVTVDGAWTNNRAVTVAFEDGGAGHIYIKSPITGTGGLTINGSGHTTTLAADITQAAIRIVDAVEVDAQLVTLSATAGDITIDGTIVGVIGGESLSLAATGDITLGGDIGNSVGHKLTEFQVDCGNDVGDTITFTENVQVVAAEIVALNCSNVCIADPGARAMVGDATSTLDAPATMATILALGDIEFNADDFRFGQNHKLTGFGDITIGGFAAPNSLSVTFGDVNAVGDLRVNANSITLLGRAGGPIVTNTGGTVNDARLDYVVGGRAYFSVAPIMGGTNPGNRAMFSNPTGNVDALGTLSLYAVTKYPSAITSGLLTGVGGQVLDLSATSGSILFYGNPATIIPQMMSSLPPIGLLGDGDTLDNDDDEEKDAQQSADKNDDSQTPATTQAEKAERDVPVNVNAVAVPVASR